MSAQDLMMWGALFSLVLFILFYNLGSTTNSGRGTASQQRHQRNIETSHRVLNTLLTIEGEGRAPRTMAYLRKIDPYVFEELLLSSFQKLGYAIERNSRYSGDGGFDGMIVSPGKERIYIQAKRYKNSISRRHVALFGELLLDQPPAKRNGLPQPVTGYFIHTGRTPRPLFELATQSGITIVSGDRLLKLLAGDPSYIKTLPVAIN